MQFQSTPSVGRATLRPRTLFGSKFISIHALRGEGDFYAILLAVKHNISIHALRGEGDFATVALPLTTRHFNPRPPWGGRLFRGLLARTRIKVFQSTPSVGRATINSAINPSVPYISIHALRGEGDYGIVFLCISLYRFQSTPSVGRATVDEFHLELNSLISIHALRGEGDQITSA